MRPPPEQMSSGLTRRAPEAVRWSVQLPWALLLQLFSLPLPLPLLLSPCLPRPQLINAVQKRLADKLAQAKRAPPVWCHLIRLSSNKRAQ